LRKGIEAGKGGFGGFKGIGKKMETVNKSEKIVHSFFKIILTERGREGYT